MVKGLVGGGGLEEATMGWGGVDEGTIGGGGVDEGHSEWEQSRWWVRLSERFRILRGWRFVG